MSTNKSNAEIKAQKMLDSIDQGYCMGDSSFMNIMPLEVGNIYHLILHGLSHYQCLQFVRADTGCERADNYAVKNFWLESDQHEDPIGINNASELINAIMEFNVTPVDYPLLPPEPVQYGLKAFDSKQNTPLSLEYKRTIHEKYTKAVHDVIKETCKGGVELLLTGKKIIELGNLDFSTTTALNAAKQLHNDGVISMRAANPENKITSYYVSLI